MINKQKLWFLTLFSLILVLSVYYIAMPEASLSSLIESKKTSSEKTETKIDANDSLATLRIEDDEAVLKEMNELESKLIDKNSNAEEKNNAYEKIQNINFNKGKEDALEKIILDTHNIKSFIKIKDDQISVTLSSKKSSYKEANNIIRTIQKEFKEKKYITVKYQ